MTKRQLIKWLEQKKTEAIMQFSSEVEAAFLKNKMKIVSEIELKSKSEIFQKKLKEAIDWYQEQIVGAIESKYGGFVEIRIGRYLDPAEVNLRFLESEDSCFNMFFNYLSDHTEPTEKMRLNYNETLNNIKSTYNAVIATVSELPNVREAIKYLEEIGFNVPKTATKSKQVTKPVNTQYLIAK